MLALNVVNFFFRMDTLWVCLQNLNPSAVYNDESKSIVQSRKNIKMSVEVLLLGNIAGLLMTPGGHIQFQIGYTFSIPILIHMVGIFPPWVTYWFYDYYCFIDLHRAAETHKVMMLLATWLIFVGPLAKQKTVDEGKEKEIAEEIVYDRRKEKIEDDKDKKIAKNKKVDKNKNKNKKVKKE